MILKDREGEKKEIIKRYRKLLRECKNTKRQEDKKLIRKAFNFALDAHKDMRRKTGEPYIYHPIEVATICAQEIGLGTTSIICALLHDVVEDTDFSIADIEGLFGKTISKIIDGLTKIKELKLDRDTPSIQAENFRKMLLTLSDDVRVILIKLADRLHNMRTLDALSNEKQLKISSETSYLYAPLAHRLGLFSLKSELEDLAIKYTEPEVYNSISNMIKETEDERKRFIQSFTAPIKIDLTEKGIKYRIIFRTKSIDSIWQKMIKKDILFHEVYDLFAVRIIIDTPIENEKNDCWKVYSILTDFYQPKQDRLRDWISIPKANGYTALHATVMSKAGKWVEVQIRSTRMDEIANKGYAAHWKYKDMFNGENALDKWLNKIRELLQNPDSDALNFLSDFKLDLFADEIFVFTPKGEMKSLPRGATALDFAFNIHSEIGIYCIGAKVNHRLVPLNYKLKSGDQIEILTSKKQKPKEEWFEYVITARAKSKIKSIIKEERKIYFKKGEKELEKLFDSANVPFTTINLKKLQERTETPSLIDLYYSIATKKINIKEIKAFLQDSVEHNFMDYFKKPFTRTKPRKRMSLAETIVEQIKDTPESLVLGEQVSKIKYTVSKCCNPIPGDNIIGIITQRMGIKIHRVNCQEALKLMTRFGNRIVKAKWRENEKSVEFLAGIKLTGNDKRALLKDIVNVISGEHQLNIRSFNIDTSEGTFETRAMIYVKDTKHLNILMDKLKKIKGIQSVKRLSMS